MQGFYQLIFYAFLKKLPKVFLHIPSEIQKFLQGSFGISTRDYSRNSAGIILRHFSFTNRFKDSFRKYFKIVDGFLHKVFQGFLLRFFQGFLLTCYRDSLRNSDGSSSSYFHKKSSKITSSDTSRNCFIQSFGSSLQECL